MRWSTKRSSGAVVGEARSRTRRWRSSGAPGGWTSSWPLMPRWPSSASPLSSGSQRYLPRRRAASIVRPVSAAAKPAGPPGRGVPAAGAAPRRAAIGRAERRARSRPRADDLDLGQLGHGLRVAWLRPGDGRRLRRRPARSRPAAISPYAVSAACLLGFLLGAADAVAVELVADADLRGEGLLVVGAVVLDDVLGHAEAVRRRRAPAGRSSSPGRRRAPRPPSISGSNRRCTTSAAASRPPVEVDRADARPRRCRTRIEALSRPPVVSSPRPSLM